MPELDGVDADSTLHGRLEVDRESQHRTLRVGALSLTAWNAGGTQQAGMWFQVELPRVGDRHRDSVPVAASRRSRRAPEMPPL